MLKIKGVAAAVSLLLFVFAGGAQATPPPITTSNVTAPADGTLLFQNVDTNPNATVTVSGTTDGTTGDLIDLGCYSGNTDYHTYSDSTGAGIPVNTDGSFSVNMPESLFNSGTCHLVAVPHGTSPAPGTSFTGPRVGFSYFQTTPAFTGGPTDDYTFDDVTMAASAASYSIDDGGPNTYLLDGTSAMNTGRLLFYYGGDFYGSASNFSAVGTSTTEDLTSSEIQIDGQNAYGSFAAANLFSGSNTLSGFPALTASVDNFNSSNGDAQTTESEPLVKCTPQDIYTPTSSTCAAFASTGVTIKRVTRYTNSGRVSTATDTFSSTDGQAHSLDLEYEMDLNGSSAGWELPGQASLSPESTGQTGPAPSSAPGTVYVIDNSGSAPGLDNPMGALSFSTPYNGVKFDNTLWPAYGISSGLFNYQEMVPAGGSTSITWSYATGSSLAEVQGYAAAAPAAMAATEDAAQAPAVAISSPAAGTTDTSSPVTVSGTASAGSGVKSVTVNGVTATVTGGSWSASVPLTALGANTLTATLTSNSGNTTAASVTVTYAPPASVSLKGERFNGRAVLVKLACSASGSPCGGKITVYSTKTVTRHHKKHRVTVVIASKRYAIGVGRTATISAGLNGTGRRLLKTLGKLKAKGTVTVTESGGKSHTAAHFGLTLKQPKKHHK